MNFLLSFGVLSKQKCVIYANSLFLIIVLHVFSWKRKGKMIKFLKLIAVGRNKCNSCGHALKSPQFFLKYLAFECCPD